MSETRSNELKLEPRRETNLDALRGLGAVAVVLLHAPPLFHSSVPMLRAMGWGIREICQVAVPLFFLISGYLAGRRSDALPGGARTLYRIGTLYLPWFVLYLAIDLVQPGRELDPVVVLRRFLGFGVDGASTSGYHLWFLPAMVWGFLGLRLACGLFGNAIPAAVAGLVLYGVVGWTTFPDGSLPGRMSPHEWLNLSLPFLAIGHAYGRHIADGNRPIRPPAWILAASATWLLVEGYALGWMHGSPFLVPPFQSGRILLPVVLLLVATSSGTWKPKGLAGKLLESLATASTGIYVLHLAILEVVPFEAIVPNGFLRDNLVRWSVTLAVSTAVTLLVLGRGPKRLRILFS